MGTQHSGLRENNNKITSDAKSFEKHARFLLDVR